MKLIFWDSLDRLRELAEIDDSLSDEEKSAEVFRGIHRFCEDHNFKIYYTRTWVEPINGEEMTIFDVGSHSEFFCVKPPLKVIY